MVSASQKAFKEQRFNDVPWPPRYPGMDDPFVNIAGAIEDFRRGPNLPARRFEKRPALIDSGNLFRSISFRLIGDEAVEVGSNLPYARFHNSGEDPPPQNIDSTVRGNLAKFLKRKSNKKYGKRLGFLFNTEVFEQSVAERRFIGVDEQTEEDIALFVENYFAEGGEVG